MSDLVSQVFRPVDDGVVLPDRIMRGRKFRGKWIGRAAPTGQIQAIGLYLETGDKPSITNLQKCQIVTETPDHSTKEVLLTWEVTDKPQDQIDEVLRLEGIETAAENSGLQHITIEQAETWITNRLLVANTSIDDVVDVATAKTAMRQILLAIQEINIKELPFFINGH